MTEGLGAAFFHFDTDVEAVVERVVAGLTDLEAVMASAGRGGNVSLGLSESVNRELNSIQQHAVAVAAQIRTTFAQAATGGGTFASPTGRSLAAELSAVRAQAARDQAQLLGGVRTAAPGLIDYRPIARQARVSLEGALAAEFDATRADILGAGARLGRGTPGIGRLTPLAEDVYGIPPQRFSKTQQAALQQFTTATLQARPELREDVDPATGRPRPGSYLEGKFLQLTGGKDDPARIERALTDWQATLTKQIESGAKLAAEQDLLASLLAQEGAGVRRINASTFLDEGTGQYYKATPSAGRAREATQAEQSYLAQQASIDAAERERRALLAEQRRATLLTSEAPLSTGQSFLGGLTQRGFFNSAQGVDASLSGLAGTAGTLVKYGVLGAAVGGGLFGISDTLREAKDYADSLVDLQNALRGYSDETGQANSVSIAYVGTLSEISRVSGANVGSAMDAAARSVRAFGDTVKDLPKADRAQALRDIGEAGAEAATKLSVISGKDLKDATGDIVAIGQAYHLQANQLNEINDAVANARNLGGDPKQIGQGLANFAEAAQLAGYNLNEAASVLSLVIAKTDESGQTAATRLSRVFQIFRGAGAQGVLEGIGVNTATSVKSQIEQVASYFSRPDVTDQQRAALTSRLGGTANLRELEPLLEDQPRLLANYQAALTHAGQGTDYFNRQVNSFAGLLKRIAGDWKNVQVELVQSDLFAPIGIALKVLEPALHTLDELLNIYNRLPGPLKTFIALTLELGLAAKILASLHEKQAAAALEAAVAEGKLTQAQAAAAKTAGVEASFEAAGIATKGARAGFTPVWTLVGNSRAAAATRAAALETQGASAAASLAAQTAPSAEAAALGAQTASAGAAETALLGGGALGFRTAAATAGGFLLGGGKLFLSLASKLLGPVGLAIAGLLAIFQVKDVFNKLSAAKNEGNTGLNTLATATTSDEFASAASQLGTAAKDNRHATSGFVGSIVSLFTGDDQAKLFEQKAKEAAAEAKALSDEQAKFAARSSVSVFGTDAVKTVDDIAGGLDRMTRAGVSARDQLAALTDVLGLIGKQEGPPKAPPVPPRQFVDSVISQFITAGTKAAGNGNSYLSTTTLPAGFRGPTTPTRLPDGTYRLPQLGVSAKDAFLDQNDSAKLRTVLLGAVDQLGLKPGQGLDPAMQKKLVDVAIANIQASGITFDDPGKIRTAITTGLTDWLNQQQSKALNSVQGPLSAQDITTALLGDSDKKTPGLLAQQQAALSSVPKSDLGGLNLRLLRSNLTALKTLASRAQDGQVPGTLVDAISDAQDAVIQATNANLEKLRLVAAANAKSATAANQINNRFHFQEAFGQGAHFDPKKGIISSNPGAADDPAQMAALIATLNADDVATIKHEIDMNVALRKAALKAAEERLAAWNQLPAALRQANPEIGAGLGPSVAAAKAGLEAAAAQAANLKAASAYAAPKITSEQLSALRQAANAAPGDSVAQAAAAVASAKADLDAAGGDQEKYLSALKTYHEAQHSYSQALSDQKSALDAYNSAKHYGPVADAAAAVRQARDQLNAATAGTAEYFKAYASYLQAVRAQAAATRANQANVELLKGDLSDPVFQASVKLHTANRQLNYDRGHGADSSQINDDRLNVRQAQLDKEGAAFSQRLHDMQTADDLGRISHDAYIRYLDHEHNRLTAVKHRTRQQQDELDQIDQALKSVNDTLQGQFNLGDIKVPSVYDVRLQAAGATGPRVQSVVNHVTIDGADFERVKALIVSLLGPTAASRYSTAPRKG